MGQDARQHWIRLRLTALLGIPLVAWFIYSIVDLVGADYETFTLWLQQPFNAVMVIALVIVTFYHAALGSEEIVEDYIHHPGFKKLKLVGIKLFFLMAAVLCVLSVVKVSFL